MENTHKRFLNRDLSLLEFNKRVFVEAQDSRNPVLERVRFLDIFFSNLDEFFMKRIGGFRDQIRAGVKAFREDDKDPREQLGQVRSEINELFQSAHEHFDKELKLALEKNGIFLLKKEQMTSEEQKYLDDFFMENVFPVLTPLVFDIGHPFPFISNLSTSVAVLMRHSAKQEEEMFARVKIPSNFPTWIRVNSADAKEFRLASLYELVARNISRLFPGMEIMDVMLFRVTRSMEIEIDQEETDDLLSLVAAEIKERRFAPIVRLQHGPRPNEKILKILKEELEIEDNDIYELQNWLEYFSLKSLVDLKAPSLKFSPWVPVTPNAFLDEDANIFDLVRQNDVLVHHPYESFSTSVERFIRTASEDPKVIAIKMTLYRTGEDSPFVPSLIQAAETGKQVVCLVELTARLDEERNIYVAKALEKAGVHVVYGVLGLKTHSKLALVVRQDADGVRCYTHVGTGNYHAKTSLVYTDLGLFTCKKSITQEVVQLFHCLSGRGMDWKFEKLLVAPMNMRAQFLRRIDREKEISQRGGKAHIIIKVNNLEDRELISALYDASQAGVKIDLIIRSICCLIPRKEKLSENIRVISILGRYLEHSRIFYFRNGAEVPQEGEFFIGSADWMFRNLSRRIEAVAPIEDLKLRQKCFDILEAYLHDERQTWDMGSDGEYYRNTADTSKDFPGCQQVFMKQALDSRTWFK